MMYWKQIHSHSVITTPSSSSATPTGTQMIWFAVMITYVQLVFIAIVSLLMLHTSHNSKIIPSIPTVDAYVVVTTSTTGSHSVPLSLTRLQVLPQYPISTTTSTTTTSRRYYSDYDNTNEATVTTIPSLRPRIFQGKKLVSKTTKTMSHELLWNKFRTIPFLQRIQLVKSAPAISNHGMPWSKSISEHYNTVHSNKGLFYMPFYTWQQSFMKQQLSNLQQHPVVSKSTGRDMSYIQQTLPNNSTTIRMHTSTYSSDEYRYIRCTTIDGGSHVQVYTSVWYPRDTSIPIFGCDLLQFNNGTKTICIVDFQPLTSDTNNNTSVNYQSKLQSIRNQYPLLQNSMTNRFYNMNDTYFSKEMLLGRCCPGPNSSTSSSSATSPSSTTNSNDDRFAAAHEMVYEQLFPAYQQYAKVHVELQKAEQQQQGKVMSMEEQTEYTTLIQQYHNEYDTYSATHDPAHALLIHYFGKEFADSYVYDILFPSCQVQH